MSKGKCEICGKNDQIKRHHWSYLPEHKNDTIDLCSACHTGVHSGKIPEPRTGRIYSVENGFMERVRPGVPRKEDATNRGRPNHLDGARIDEMRRGGYTWLQIAFELSCSVNGARRAWKAWTERVTG